MPKEVFNTDEFVALAVKASECRIKRLGEIMKIKLRTPRALYTIKLDKGEGEAILGKISCPKKEV